MDVVPEHDGHFPYRRDICSVLVHNYRWPTNSLLIICLQNKFYIQKTFSYNKKQFLKKKAKSHGKFTRQIATAKCKQYYIQV